MHAALLAAQLVLSAIRVIDGDTLHDNARGHDYRLAGVDAPEIRRAHCPAERALGEAAAAEVRSMLAAAERVTAAPAWDPRGRKRWPVQLSRRLAVVTVDGEDLGAALLARGLARPVDVATGEPRGPGWCPP